MSWWSRIANVFRGERMSREIDEEIRAHIAEAIEQGRDPAEARRAFGAALRTREECRDFRVLAWLDSLRADTVFAYRQFLKHKVTSAAAVLSLALAIGACTSALRLIDAILLRSLPVAAPEQLYAVVRQGDNVIDDKPTTYAEWPYPSFRLMRGAQAGDIARRVTAEVLRVVALGALAGFGLGMLSARYITALLYEVRPGDPTMLAMPSAILLGMVLIAAVPAVVHAVRIDPVAMLRAD